MKCEARRVPIGARRDVGGGYWRIKTAKGWPYEHRVVAEKKIGRALRPGEVVHHIDGDPSNNKPENLVVCRTMREHLDKYHAGDLKNPPTHRNGRKPKGSPGWRPLVKR